MKKAIAMGLAAIVAAGAFAIAPTEASAGSGIIGRRARAPPELGLARPTRTTIAIGTRARIFRSVGRTSGSRSASRFIRCIRHHTYRYAYANPHVAWCAAHFRTYNPGNNMYFAKKGVMVACNSPYAY